MYKLIAPNLVKVVKDKHGSAFLVRAFNTQACEQLNAWLGGFESILKRMKITNFDWFLHTMLFYHTTQVLDKQHTKETLHQIQDDEDIEDELEDIGQIHYWDD